MGWGIVEDACASMGTKVEREIFPAGTDSRFLREIGVPSIGFSPMAETPILLHEHNEALSVATFLRGIAVYERIIFALAEAGLQVGESGTGDAASEPKRAKF